jgi:hypothetical protein
MIHVFKTSVKYKKEIKKVAHYLDELKLIISWNFDLEDCDHILRIETEFLKATDIIYQLSKAGVTCEELS